MKIAQMEDNDNDGWTRVERRKRGKGKSCARESLPSPAQLPRRLAQYITDVDREPAVRKELQQARSLLEATPWWKQTLEHIRDAVFPRRVVEFHCLGIGSFSKTLYFYRAGPRYQFALALMIKDCFASIAKCTFAEPDMEEVDWKIAKDFGFEIVETTFVQEEPTPNTVAVSRPAHDECVLWFMPHCRMELYECVLLKFESFGYDGMVIFGNKLTGYNDNDPNRGDIKSQVPLLHGLCQEDRFEERDCPYDSVTHYKYGMNDLSIVTVRSDRKL